MHVNHAEISKPSITEEMEAPNEIQVEELFSPSVRSPSPETGTGARSLFDMAMDVVIKNINQLEDFGSTPFHIVQRLLPYIHRSEHLALLEEKSPEIRPLCAGRWFTFIKRDIPTWRRYLLQTPKPDGTFRTEKELAIKATGSMYRRCLIRDQKDQAEAERGLTTANVGNAEAKKQAAPNMLKAPPPNRRKPRDKFQQKRWNQIFKGVRTDLARRPGGVLVSPDRAKEIRMNSTPLRETAQTTRVGAIRPTSSTPIPVSSKPESLISTSSTSTLRICKGDDGPIARMVRRNAQRLHEVLEERKSSQSVSSKSSTKGTPVASAKSSRVGTPVPDASPVLAGIGAGHSHSRRDSISSLFSSGSSSRSTPPVMPAPPPSKRRRQDPVLVPTKRVRK